jgi:toxin YoeB
MKKFIFHSDALEDFVNWSILNRNIFKKISELLKEIGRSPFEGKGKPEPLKYELKGCWSRRITDEHRLVYFIDNEGNIEILSCKGNYE